VGNVLETDLRTLMGSEKQIRFGIEKRNSLPKKCVTCKWFFACHGECPKHRFNSTETGETGLNALCEGYRMFFSHIAPYMERMRQLLAEGKAPALIMRDFTEQEPASQEQK
jgi:uncharacterized protein